MLFGMQFVKRQEGWDQLLTFARSAKNYNLWVLSLLLKV